MWSNYNLFVLTQVLCPLCCRAEALFTVKCLVLQIPFYLQDDSFGWYSYRMELVWNLQLTSSHPQHLEREV